jgi:kynurenine formamidase
LRPGLPLYGGRNEGFQLTVTGDLSRGDSAASLRLTLANHVGTHIDFPAHVHLGGRTLDDYPAEFFIFHRPVLLEVPLSAGRHLTAADLNLSRPEPGADIILIRTGFPYGGEDYWRDNPGLDQTAAEFLKNLSPPLRAVGLDFISVNRWPDREPGRAAHKILLAEPEILIIEDMELGPLAGRGRRLRRVTAAPLRVAGADGAPAVVLGELTEAEGGGYEQA